MAAKDVRFGDDVRQKMVKGVNTLANAVKVTPVSYTHLTLPTKREV
mgnify:CR=1 FL=1